MTDEDGETVIEARLTAEADQTRLVIEERGLPLGELAAHGAGWQAHVEDLATHLAGQAPADWKTRWLELTPSYPSPASSSSWRCLATPMRVIEKRARQLVERLTVLAKELVEQFPASWIGQRFEDQVH